MKIGTKVYMLDNGTVKTGVIVSSARRWENIIPHREYVVREVKDLGRDGIAGVLAAAFNGTPDSLTMHTANTLYMVHEQPVKSEEASE